MRVLITGAAGFIGSKLANNLALLGHDVYALDNINDYYDVQLKQDRVKHFLKLPNILFKQLDICSVTDLKDFFSIAQPEYVIHLAAQAGVRYSMEKPHEYLSANLVGMGNILEEARLANVKHLLYASSSSVYGNNVSVPFSESDDVDHPLSLYAATKRANELMAHSYSYLYGLPTTGLRFFTVYGPWGRPDMAYYSFTEKIFSGAPLTIYADGLLKRDFTYIDDVVSAVSELISPAHIPAPGSVTSLPDKSLAPFSILNVGNNQPVAVIDLVRSLEKKIGQKANIFSSTSLKSEVDVTYANPSKLNAMLGFSPKTTLSDGVSKFIDWYRSYYDV